MTYEAALRRLEAGLRGPLPGTAAQEFLAPKPRREWPDGLDPATIRHAAGLLLVFPRDDKAQIILTVRTDRLRRHKGQVSLPGGVVDPGETFEQAAIREAHEEIGIEPAMVRPIGLLTPVDIPVSGFRLHPVVATTPSAPLLRPSDFEVARIIEVPAAELLACDNRQEIRVMRGDQPVVAPCFRIRGLEVWGATAMVLAEFLAVLGWNPAGPD
ncbi:MAG: CoA pyrophosphatase [Vicinamibacterales bacterium]